MAHPELEIYTATMEGIADLTENQGKLDAEKQGDSLVDTDIDQDRNRNINSDPFMRKYQRRYPCSSSENGDDNNTLRISVARLRLELSKCEGQIDQQNYLLQNERDRFARERDILHSRLSEFESDNIELRETTSRLHSETAGLTKERDALHDSLSEANLENCRLQSSLSDTSKQNDSLCKKSVYLEDDRDKLLGSLKQISAVMGHQMDNAKQSSFDKADLIAKMTKIQEERDELQSALSTVKLENSEVEAQCVQLTLDRDQLTAKIGLLTCPGSNVVQKWNNMRVSLSAPPPVLKFNAGRRRRRDSYLSDQEKQERALPILL